MNQTIREQLAEAESENKQLMRLLDLRRQNWHLRVSTQIPEDNRKLLEVAIDESAKAFGVSQAQIFSRNRAEPVALARHVVFWIMRNRSGMTLQGIGKVLQRDHGSVLHGLGNVENRRVVDEKFSALFNAILFRVEKAMQMETATTAAAHQSDATTTPTHG